jgi:acyl-CoA thioesterase YciA
MSDSPSANAAAVLKSLPTDMELVLKVIPMPADCNANGDIFGGWVMAQCDLAGSVIPARYTKGRMATVAVNEFIFKQPVRHRRHPVFLFEAGATSGAPRSR